MADLYTEKIKNLPITPYLENICAALKKSTSHFMVLTAETAAGKSTAVPLALLKHFNGKIVMLEPRRLAVLNIATRVADLLDEEVGATCGYQMHLESKMSSKTRFAVLTEAILTKKIQEDPLLEGTSVVVIDEFHERSIHADLALAFLKESIEMRDDLFVIVMSATIDTEKTALYLGRKKDDGTVESAPVFHVPGRQFPVKIEYAGDVTPAHAVLEEVKTRNDDGSILVFLPGISDIRKTKAELEEAHIPLEIFVLHSSVSFAEQKKVLLPKTEAKRRVILSSAIAETSLTVPDVTVVIDSGLSRMNIFNRIAGMETLVTRRESVFNAEQRAGRAGRIAPGRCIRLWNENDVRTSEFLPEILRTDLSSLVLECAEWGVSSVDKLSWLDKPQESSWKTAGSLLKDLGCLTSIGSVENSSEEWKITTLGKAVLTIGVHPRLACVALSGISFGQKESSIKQAAKYASLKDVNQQKIFETDLLHRIEKIERTYGAQLCSLKKYTPGFALLVGFPDRIARRLEVSENKALYQFPSGRMAVLTEETQTYPQYIIAPEADAGERTGRIYAWEKIDESDAEEWLFDHATTYTETVFSDNQNSASKGYNAKLQKTEYTSYGKLVLKTKKLQPERTDYTQAVCKAVENFGIKFLPLSNASENLLLRVQFYLANKDENSLQDRFIHLSETASTWLVPFLSDSNKITEETVYNALNWYLEGDMILKSVPSELKLPSGKYKKIVYEQHNGIITPVLEVIIQQIFGCMTTPRIMGVPVLLKLLSPARRPLQITDDLEHFWQTTWPEICKEMKGRYPKHNWDYRVVSNEE